MDIALEPHPKAKRGMLVKRDLEDVSCQRKIKYKNATLSGAIVDLNADPYQIPSSAILQYRDYKGSKLETFDRELLDDLLTRGSVIYQK